MTWVLIIIGISVIYYVFSLLKDIIINLFGAVLDVHSFLGKLASICFAGAVAFGLLGLIIGSSEAVSVAKFCLSSAVVLGLLEFAISLFKK